MDAEFRFGIVSGVIIGALIMWLVFIFGGVTMAGTDAYCAALGGESITYAVCDVDGRVVNMP